MTFDEAKTRADAVANVGTPMPQYKSHKTVCALKIAEVVPAPKPTIKELERILSGVESTSDVGAIIIPAEKRFGPFTVTRDYVSKHEPQAGGYFVVYKDGYRSFSPAAAFEEGYTKI